MSLDEDPYFVVRDDVNDSLNKADLLLSQLHSRKAAGAADNEIADIARDLRNSIRSIEWDLEDLQETVSIVEKNPERFHLTHSEVSSRKQFIATVKQRTSVLKISMSDDSSNSSQAPNKLKKLEKQSLLQASSKQGSYSSSAHESNKQFLDDTKQQQQLIIKAQDEQIDNIGASVQVLKNISSHIGNELEEQSVLLDHMGHEMDNTGSKMDSTMKKIAKVTKMSNDRRQWCAIGILVVLIIVLIVLFSVL